MTGRERARNAAAATVAAVLIAAVLALALAAGMGWFGPGPIVGRS